MGKLRNALLGAFAALATASSAVAAISDDVVKSACSTTCRARTPTAGEGASVAARMAVEDFGGKVLGKPIEVVKADHLNKVDVGMVTARRWYDTEKVDAIFASGTLGSRSPCRTSRARRTGSTLSRRRTPDLTQAVLAQRRSLDVRQLRDARATAMATMKEGGDSWFFITADYAFGHSMEASTRAVVESNGGKVVGAVRAPINTSDFSSFVMQAQASKAKVIGLANAGADMVNTMKQLVEFGVPAGGQRIVGLLVNLTDVHALGLKTAQGLMFTDSFYWDYNDQTRAFSERFKKIHGKPPTGMRRAPTVR